MLNQKTHTLFRHHTKKIHLSASRQLLSARFYIVAKVINKDAENESIRTIAKPIRSISFGSKKCANSFYRYSHDRIFNHVFNCTRGVMWSGFEITLALVLLVLSVIYYLRLDKSLGFLMLLIYAIAYPFAYKIAQLNVGTWLTISIASFAVGWVFQFVGHFYEKKKPAFVDDIVGLAIGPLFVLAEFVFLLGFRKDLQRKMLAEARKQRSAMDQKSLQTLHAK